MFVNFGNDFYLLLEAYVLDLGHNLLNQWKLFPLLTEYHVFYKLCQHLARSRFGYVLLKEAFSLPLCFDFHVVTCAYVTLCNNSNERVKIPLRVSILELKLVWLVPRCPSVTSLGCASQGERPIKVNKGNS